MISLANCCLLFTLIYVVSFIDNQPNFSKINENLPMLPYRLFLQFVPFLYLFSVCLVAVFSRTCFFGPDEERPILLKDLVHLIKIVIVV